MVWYSLRTILSQSLHRRGLLAWVEGERRIVTVPAQWSILIWRIYWRRLHGKPRIDVLLVISRWHFNVSLWTILLNLRDFWADKMAMSGICNLPLESIYGCNCWILAQLRCYVLALEHRIWICAVREHGWASFVIHMHTLRHTMAEGWVRCIGCMDQLLVLAEMFLLWDAIIDSNTRLLTLISFLFYSIFFELAGHIDHFVLLTICSPHEVVGKDLLVGLLLMHVLMCGGMAEHGIAHTLTIWSIEVARSGLIIIKVSTLIARIVIHLNRLLTWHGHQFETWLMNWLWEARLLLHHAWVTFVHVAIMA